MFQTPLAQLLWATAMVLADIASNLVAPGISLYLAQVGARTFFGPYMFFEGFLVVVACVFIFTYLLVLLEGWRNSLTDQFGPLRVIANKVLFKGNLICFVTSLYFLCITDMPSITDDTFYTPFMFEATTLLYIILKFMGYIDPPNLTKD